MRVLLQKVGIESRRAAWNTSDGQRGCGSSGGSVRGERELRSIVCVCVCVLIYVRDTVFMKEVY
jgi:hypothetical protein